LDGETLWSKVTRKVVTSTSKGNNHRTLQLGLRVGVGKGIAMGIGIGTQQWHAKCPPPTLKSQRRRKVT